MFPYSDRAIVAARQDALRQEAARERLAASARRTERPAGGWFTKRFGGFVVGRLGRHVAAAR